MIPCNRLQRWWHQRKRWKDHTFIFPDGSLGIWSDDINGHGPNYYHVLNFPHWNCDCATVDRLSAEKDKRQA